MEKKHVVNAQMYAGRMVEHINALLRTKNRFIEEMLQCGIDHDKAVDTAERIYENAWKFVNEQNIE